MQIQWTLECKKTVHKASHRHFPSVEHEWLSSTSLRQRTQVLIRAAHRDFLLRFVSCITRGLQPFLPAVIPKLWQGSWAPIPAVAQTCRWHVWQILSWCTPPALTMQQHRQRSVQKIKVRRWFVKIKINKKELKLFHQRRSRPAYCYQFLVCMWTNLELEKTGTVCSKSSKAPKKKKRRPADRWKPTNQPTNQHNGG